MNENNAQSFFSNHEFIWNRNHIKGWKQRIKKQNVEVEKNKYRVCKVGTWKFNVIKTGRILLRKEAKRVEGLRVSLGDEEREREEDKKNID